MTNISERDIDRLRSLFLTAPCKTYTDSELKFIVDSNIVLEALLEEAGNIQKAFNSGVKLLSARSSLKIPQISSIDYPLEVHQISCIFTSGTDRSGCPTLWLRIGLPHPPISVTNILLEYVIWRLEGIVRRASAENKRITIALDCKNLHFSYHFMRNIAFPCRKIFPFCLASKLHLINLSSTMAYFIMLMKYLLPKRVSEAINVIREEDLTIYFTQENLPDYLGGSIFSVPDEVLTSKVISSRNPYIIPENSHLIIGKFFEYLGFKNEDIRDIQSYFNQLKQYVNS